MDDEQVERINGAKELFLLDSSALQVQSFERIPSWASYRYSEFPRVVADDMRYIGSFLRFAGNNKVVVIKEVILEREHFGEIVGTFLNGCKITYKEMKEKMHRV